MKFKFDWFLKGMLIAVGLAFLWPAPGAKGGAYYGVKTGAEFKVGKKGRQVLVKAIVGYKPATKVA